LILEHTCRYIPRPRAEAAVAAATVLVPNELARPNRPDELPTLTAGGFGAAVDAYAWEPHPDAERREMRLWFLSLLGAQQALKALWARLLKGELATLRVEALGHAQFCGLAPEGARGWRRFTAGLPAAGGHQLVLLPAAACFQANRPDFLLLARSEDDLPGLHWRFLNRRADLPIHPTWAVWLWERAVRTEEAIPLQGAGVRGYRCQPDLPALEAAVSTAVRRRILTVEGPDEYLA
jgi:hypothetical protein